MLASSIYCSGLVSFYGFRLIQGGINNLIRYRDYKQNPDNFMLWIRNPDSPRKNLDEIQTDKDAIMDGMKEIYFFDIRTLFYPVIIPIMACGSFKKENIADFLLLFMNKE